MRGVAKGKGRGYQEGACLWEWLTEGEGLRRRGGAKEKG